jgi:hypothetical protein
MSYQSQYDLIKDKGVGMAIQKAVLDLDERLEDYLEDERKRASGSELEGLLRYNVEFRFWKRHSERSCSTV